MEVFYRLASRIACVCDQAEAAFLDAFNSGNFSDGVKNCCHELRIFEFEDVFDVFFGHNERMDRRLCGNIFKCDDEIIFVNDGRRDLSVNDFAENAVVHNVFLSNLLSYGFADELIALALFESYTDDLVWLTFADDLQIAVCMTDHATV